MLAPLVLVLALFGILMLVVGERMGLPVVLGVPLLHVILALLVVWLGLGSVTSRFERFCTGSAGKAPGFVVVLARSTCLLILLVSCLPQNVSLAWLYVGFIGGGLLGHLARKNDQSCVIARLAEVAAAGATAVVLVLLLPRLVQQFAFATGYVLKAAMTLLALGALAVLVPGGAWAVRRLQVVLLIMTLLLAVGPIVVLLGLSWAEIADPLALEIITRLSFLSPGDDDLLARPAPLLGVAAALGFAARGRGEMRAAQAAAGVVAATALTGFLTALAAFGQEWIAGIVGTRILGVPPQQWPAFVFDEELRGWLRACGQGVVDPLLVARGCVLSSASSVLGGGAVTVQGLLNGVALARSNGLPAVLGVLWQLLPPMLAFAGALTLFHAVGVSISEGVLFRTINPTGLRSWRLAMARLSIAAGVLAAFWFYPGGTAHASTLIMAGNVLMAFVVMASVLAWGKARRMEGRLGQKTGRQETGEAGE